MADEPTSALDVTVQQRILDLLDELRAEGTGILLITHDLAVAGERADRVAVMRAGRIVEAGPARTVLTAPTSDYTRQLLRDAPSFAAFAPQAERVDGQVVADGRDHVLQDAAGGFVVEHVVGDHRGHAEALRQLRQLP